METDAYLEIELDGTAQVDPSAVHRLVFVDSDISTSDGSSGSAGILASSVTIVIVAAAVVNASKFKNRERESSPEKEEISEEVSVAAASI